MKTYEEYILELETLYNDVETLKTKVQDLESLGRQLFSDTRQLQSDTRKLQSDTRLLQTESSRVKQIIQKDSVNLTSLLFETVYPVNIHPSATELASGAIHTAGTGSFTFSSGFDITQRSKDSAGNLSIPHAFYIVSPFCADLTGGFGGGPRDVTYNGPRTANSDITVSLVRFVTSAPTQIATKVLIFNPFAAADVYVKVLKLLGAR